MNIKIIIQELEEIIEKLKLKIICYETENKELKKRLKDIQRYIINN